VSVPGTEGLSLDQAPPLEIPASFFLTAPLALLAAGALLLLGDRVLVTPYLPTTIALAHLGTLGFLAMVMFGALVQMLPVVAGSPVPAVRLAHGLHAALGLGVGLAVLGLLGPVPGLVSAGGVLLTVAVLGLVGTVGVALVRAPRADATVWGMRIAVLCLVALAVLGVLMGRGHAGGPFPGARPAWMQVHLTLGLVGWVGALLVAVSWRVVPMFYLTAEPRRAAAALAALAVGLLGAVAALALGMGPIGIAIASAPAVVVVWGVHPIATLRALHRRRRKRADGSLRFWQLGLVLGLLCGPLGLATVIGAHPSAGLLFGWVAIWGWAGVIMHGMLCRIVPFLVWFHRLSRWVGVVPVPPMRRLLPDTHVRRGLVLHAVSVALGAAAIVLHSDLLTRLTGVGLVAVALNLGFMLVLVLRVRAPKAPVPDPG
jgi:hypothetical protein